MKNPLFNFSAGPALLPEPVFEKIAQDLKNSHQGMSVMELSHRIPEIMAMTERTSEDLRAILQIPAHFKILFMQGGARTQFSTIPLNLLGSNNDLSASYLITGYWSKQSMLEAKRYAALNTFSDLTQVKEVFNSAYLHCTDNETIDGIELPHLPASSIPLVIDASSSILSKGIDFKDVGIVYAATQKNMGIAGLTVVIVREDLIGHAHPLTPTMLNYQSIVDCDSMVNTPPVFCWYVTGLVLKWVQSQGGIAGIKQQVLEKSTLLYDMIDNSQYYRNTIDSLYRSKMNIPFNLPTIELEKEFLQEAEKKGLYYLKGHRVLGGIRASIYNAMPLKGVQALVQFMKQFAQTH